MCASSLRLIADFGYKVQDVIEYITNFVYCTLFFYKLPCGYDVQYEHFLKALVNRDTDLLGINNILH